MNLGLKITVFALLITKACNGLVSSASIEVSEEAKVLQGIKTLLFNASKEMRLEDVKAILLDKDNDGRTLLHVAVQNLHVGIVRFLLQVGVIVKLVNERDRFGRTPLHVIAAKSFDSFGLTTLNDMASTNFENNEDYHRFTSIVDLLITLSDSINAKDENKLRPLHLAAQNGHSGMVEQLLNHFAKVNAKDEKMQRPLHLAAINGHTAIVARLLRAGAAINEIDRDGQTPFFLAAKNNRFGVVTLLLNERDQKGRRKVDAERADNNNQTPLYAAVAANHIGVAKLLLDDPEVRRMVGGIDNVNRNNNRTMLQEAAANSRADIVLVLLQAKPDLNKGDQPPCHLAAANGCLDVIEVLIMAGVSLDAVDSKRRTPLHSAGANGNVLVVDHLLNIELVNLRPEKVNVPDIDGQTALHLAVSNNQLKVVDRLLEAFKIDVNARNVNGETPLYIAVAKRHYEIVKLLLAKCSSLTCANNSETSPLLTSHAACRLKVDLANTSGRTPLHVTTINYDLEIANLLVRYGANVNAADDCGETPLHLISRYGGSDDEFTKYFIQSVLTSSRDKRNAYLRYMTAAQARLVGVVKLLLQKKASANAADTDDMTPLQMVIDRGGHAKLVELLLSGSVGQRAASLTLPRSYYQPFELDTDVTIEKAEQLELVPLAAEGCYKFAELLLENHAYVDAISKTGLTPLHCASLGSIRLVKLLLAKGANVNIVDKKRQTPLHAAVSSGYDVIMSRLKDI